MGYRKDLGRLNPAQSIGITAMNVVCCFIPSATMRGFALPAVGSASAGEKQRRGTLRRMKVASMQRNKYQPRLTR